MQELDLAGNEVSCLLYRKVLYDQHLDDQMEQCQPLNLMADGGGTIARC